MLYRHTCIWYACFRLFSLLFACLTRMRSFPFHSSLRRLHTHQPNVYLVHVLITTIHHYVAANNGNYSVPVVEFVASAAGVVGSNTRNFANSRKIIEAAHAYTVLLFHVCKMYNLKEWIVLRETYEEYLERMKLIVDFGG